MIRFAFLPIVAVCVLAASPADVFASRELRNKLAGVAKDVMKNTRLQPVTIGQFSPTGLPATNSGPGIEGILKVELELLSKGIVRDDARFEVKGDYALVPSRTKPGLKEIKIGVRLIDKESAEELKDLAVKVRLTANQSIAQLLQVTANLPPHGGKLERNQELEKRAKNPQVFVHGGRKTLISSSSDSPYAVELLVKRNAGQAAAPRAATVEDGRAFVNINRGELYKVKVYNNSKRAVAVALSIDGLDQFHFSKDRNPKTGRPRFTHFIIDPKSTTTIVGWHHSVAGKKNFLSFLVTAYGQGAVSQAGVARGSVGVLHLQFSNCTALPLGGASRSGNETGFGPPRTVKQRIASYEIEPPHDFVSVRYTR